MPGKPRYLCYASANNTVYCGGDRGTAALIDGQGDSIRAVLELGTTRCGVKSACWNPLAHKYYCVKEDGTDLTYLFVIDGFGDSLLARITLGAESEEGVCYNPANNRVYCVGANDTLWVINCTADTIENTIGLPEYVPGQVVCSPQSSRLYCLPPVGEINNLKRVMVIDCAGDSFLKFLPTGRLPVIMGYDPVQDRVHCVNHKTDDATVVDCAGDSVLTTVGLGFRPRRLAYASNENKGYCGGESFERVIAIDAETNRAVAEIPVGYEVTDLCYNPVLSKLYCIDEASDSVTVIDCVTDTVAARIGVGRRPGYLAFSPAGGSKVYCSNMDQRIVSVIDCVRDSVIAGVGVRGLARYLLVNTRESKVYCQTRGDLVSVIDCEGDTFAGVCNTGGRVLAYNPIENKAYFGYDYMFVVDGVTDSVVAVLDTVDANWWNRGCFNDRDNKAYVIASMQPALLMAIDGVADTVTALISYPAGGSGLFALYYNRINNKVYIASNSGGFVIVLDGATDSILGTIVTGACPRALVRSPIQNRTYVAAYLNSCISVIRDSMVAGVTGNPVRRTQPMTFPSILRRGTSITSRERLVIVDCTGRRVAELRAGTRTRLELPTGVYYALPRKRGPVRRLLVVD